MLVIFALLYDYFFLVYEARAWSGFQRETHVRSSKRKSYLSISRFL